MGMSISKAAFFEAWHRQAKEPVGPLSEEEARQRDASGEPYVAVLVEAGRPSAFVEITGGEFYGVSFLDEDLREYLAYTFEVVDRRLFLSEAVHREFDGQSQDVVRGAVHRFSPDGRASVEESGKPFPRATMKEHRVDVSGNWEEMPRFGDYARLLRKER